MEISDQIYAPEAVALEGNSGVGVLGGLMSPRVSLDTMEKRKIS